MTDGRPRTAGASTPEDAVEALTGRRPDKSAASELDWYLAVRDSLREARNDAELNQQSLAAMLGVRQSEISRLENSLGFGTRLGKLRGYLSACGARMIMRIVTAKGRTVMADREASEETVPLGPYYFAPPNIFVDDVGIAATDLPYIAETLPALDGAMADVHLDPEQARELRRCFLQRLGAQRRLRGMPGSGMGSIGSPELSQSRA